MRLTPFFYDARGARGGGDVSFHVSRVKPESPVQLHAASCAVCIALLFGEKAHAIVGDDINNNNNSGTQQFVSLDGVMDLALRMPEEGAEGGGGIVINFDGELNLTLGDLRVSGSVAGAKVGRCRFAHMTLRLLSALDTEIDKPASNSAFNFQPAPLHQGVCGAEQ